MSLKPICGRDWRNRGPHNSRKVNLIHGFTFLLLFLDCMKLALLCAEHHLSSVAALDVSPFGSHPSQTYAGSIIGS